MPSGTRSLGRDRGVSFLRIHIEDVLRLRDAGCPVEFETLGPYLANYIARGGIMKTSNLTNEDAIGLEVAVALRKIFQTARIISLCDDYNSTTNLAEDAKPPVVFTDTAKANLRSSLIALFKERGIISPQAIDGKDFLLIAESSKTQDAATLTLLLEKKGRIYRRGNEIFFVNDAAENPEYKRIRLKTKENKWLCVALDAATYLKAENFSIVHIVVLPDYMERQQDQVREILRVLGMAPDHYHNIFYDATCSPLYVAGVIEREFRRRL